MNELNKKQKIIIFTIACLTIIISFYLINNRNNEFEELTEGIEENNISNITNESKIGEQNTNKIKIHISGAVNKEGLIELDKESRIDDAIEKAGGLKEDANIDNINLAYKIEDGMKIHIPTNSEIEKQKTKENEVTVENNYIISSSGINNSNSKNDKQKETSNTKININKASQEELETLPGIGPTTALKIINYRNEKGKFSSIEEIKEVSGIGEAKFNKIKDLIIF